MLSAAMGYLRTTHQDLHALDGELQLEPVGTRSQGKGRPRQAEVQHLAPEQALDLARRRCDLLIGHHAHLGKKQGGQVISEIIKYLFIRCVNVCS